MGSVHGSLGLDGGEFWVGHEFSLTGQVGYGDFGVGGKARYVSKVPVPNPAKAKLNLQPVTNNFVGVEIGGGLIFAPSIKAGYDVL